MTFKVQKNTEKTENLKRFIKCVFELLLPSNTFQQRSVTATAEVTAAVKYKH